MCNQKINTQDQQLRWHQINRLWRFACIARLHICSGLCSVTIGARDGRVQWWAAIMRCVRSAIMRGVSSGGISVSITLCATATATAATEAATELRAYLRLDELDAHGRQPGRDDVGEGLEERAVPADELVDPRRVLQ